MRTVLPVPAPNLEDAAIKLGLAPNHEIAPRLFGTEPLFPNHPRGRFGQVARALYWSALATVPAGL